MDRVGVRRCLGAEALFGVSALAASMLASDMSALLPAGLLYIGVVRQLDGTTRAPLAWDRFIGVSSSAAG